MNIFQYYLDENHLKPGTKLKKGDEELKVVKPVGDDKYLVKEEDLDEANLPKWEVSYEYGPHMSKSEVVDAKTKEDAVKKVINAAKKRGQHPMLNYVRPSSTNEGAELTEAKHRVSVTVSDPNHTAVSKRKEQTQKTVRLSAENESDAVTKAKAFYKKQGYKVHDAAHVGMVQEEVELDEASLIKKIKRAVAGWGAFDKDKPKDIVKRNKSHSDATVKLLHGGKKPGHGSPAALQQKVLDREMKRRGLTKEEVEQTDESAVARTVNGKRYVSAEAAIRLAREIAAKRKEGEKATHKDLQAASAALRKEEVEPIDELSKTTLSGYVAKAASSKVWHQDNAKYARQDQQDDIADEEEAKANKRKAGIKRAISKITKEAVEQIDELSKETHMSYATVAGDHAVRLAKAIKVRREQGKGSSQEVKDMEDERDKRVAGLSRLAKRVAESEQLDELNSDTLKSYADKRMERVKARYAALTDKQRSGEKVSNKEIGEYNKDTKKDLDNINKARDKAAYKRQGSRVDRDGD